MINKIIYNGYTLETSSSMTISNANDDDGVDNEVNSFAFPNSDGRKYISDYKRVKNIVISGILKGTSIGDLNNKIDFFKRSILQGNSQILVYKDIGNSEVIRKGIGIVTNGGSMITRIGQQLTFANFKINITILDGYLEKETSTTLNDNGVGNAAFNIVYEGTTETKPILTTTITSVGDMNKFEFEMGVDKIVIDNFTFSTGNIIIIDCKNEYVTIDGNLVDFKGFFPSQFTANGFIRTFNNESVSTATFDYSYSYIARYL